jgi:hypothetical protein
LQGLRDLLPRPKLTPVKICPVFAPHNDGSAHANHYTGFLPIEVSALKSLVSS